MEQNKAIELVVKELNTANEKFPLFNSPHEGYAVLLEEVDELWDEIKGDKAPLAKVRQKEEAIQVAAMALKFLISCCSDNL